MTKLKNKNKIIFANVHSMTAAEEVVSSTMPIVVVVSATAVDDTAVVVVERSVTAADVTVVVCGSVEDVEFLLR